MKDENPEPEGFFDITLRHREDNWSSYEERYRREEHRKYNTIMRLARNRCPINYADFCRLLKYKHNINYFGTKNLTNRYVDDLISVGKLRLSEDHTLTIAEVKTK